MRRAVLLLALLAALVAATASAAPAAGAASWHSEQPAGAGVGAPTEIGEIGDIEFWAPNHGMLITAGNQGVPAGLFAYDGSGWYRYSTVCGGHEGRIAWAGPDDFWTISDQQAGQQTGQPPPQHISLCHFVNGAVVASYAEPVGFANSYLPLNAAVCLAPNDCWFAGDRLGKGNANVGAFHLHWDGANLTAIPALTALQPGLADPGRTVTSLAAFEGGLYEGVEVQEDDVAPGESAEPSFVHQIVSQGGSTAFVPLFPPGPLSPEPTQLGAVHLAAGGGELWALAGAAEGSTESPLALRLGAAGFERVKLTGGPLGPGTVVRGAAVEPGGGGVWVSYMDPGEFFEAAPARLTQIHPDGSVAAATVLPTEPIGEKWAAGPIACPAAEQCWMGTAKGWLFHLGASDLPQDPDPYLHALVTFRPPDPSLPSVPPISLPEDNSGANAFESPKGVGPEGFEEPLPKRTPALYSKVKSKLLQGNVLQLSFVLGVKAKVQLLAERKGKVVAKTSPVMLDEGKQQLRLKLDPKRWPTKLNLRVQPLKGKGK